MTDTRRGAGRYTRAQEDLLGSQRCSLGARRTYQAFSAVKSAARGEIEHEGLARVPGLLPALSGGHS